MVVMNKGEETREAILDEATRLASRIGLEALSIGKLAQAVGMSKSGLFAHFGAKETLQHEVLAYVADSFVAEVIRPALAAPRGEPRIRLVFDNWLRWTNTRHEGGCPIVQATVEYDDRPGPLRDYLADLQNRWLGFIEGAAELAVEEGQFGAGLDPSQFAFEFNALLLGYHYTARMIADPTAESRVRASFEELLNRSRA
jgi:AcrR family transcriptional regulator